MFVQVLFAREAVADTPLAALKRAHVRDLRAAVVVVYLSFVAQKATTVREALNLVAIGVFASVRTCMLIGVFSRLRVSMNLTTPQLTLRHE